MCINCDIKIGNLANHFKIVAITTGTETTDETFREAYTLAKDMLQQHEYDDIVALVTEDKSWVQIIVELEEHHEAHILSIQQALNQSMNAFMNILMGGGTTSARAA